ncbi:MAG: ROK family protein [Mariprofundaceae bacterium]|nr:ROK family protein [Mariprofundaceae bacterium]
MRFGIDLGGSKTELIALDKDGAELLRLRRPSPAGDYQATLHVMADLVAQAEAQLACSASVGIGTPGAISSKTGRMKNCNSTCLNDQPLQQDIQTLLRREVRLSNDANCFALSEACGWRGGGRSRGLRRDSRHRRRRRHRD